MNRTNESSNGVHDTPIPVDVSIRDEASSRWEDKIRPLREHEYAYPRALSNSGIQELCPSIGKRVYKVPMQLNERVDLICLNWSTCIHHNRVGCRCSLTLSRYRQFYLYAL